VSLGSGSDTRFFRLKQKYPNISLIYHEFDFPSNTAAKIRQMQMPPFAQTVKKLCNIDLRSENTKVSAADEPNQSLHIRADNCSYHLHPSDLRALANLEAEQGLREQAHSEFKISASVPTLLLSECCLIYLSPQDADGVLSYFTSAFPPAIPLGVIIYEPIRPNDAFGRTMVSNLTARGIHLQTLTAHDTLGAQKKRLVRHGFGRVDNEAGGGAEAADVEFIWETWIEETEKERVETLEWMDEVEEWKLLARHYCIDWGWRETTGPGDSPVFESWKDPPVQDSDD
jgi:[phosphatase 2A protein]-leucine-carboxy methyltransferase